MFIFCQLESSVRLLKNALDAAFVTWLQQVDQTDKWRIEDIPFSAVGVLSRHALSHRLRGSFANPCRPAAFPPNPRLSQVPGCGLHR